MRSSALCYPDMKVQSEFSAPKNIQMRENEFLLLQEHSDYLTSQLGKVLAGTADYQLEL